MQNFTYAYDRVGNVTRLRDDNNGGQRQCFVYDSLNRLIDAEVGEDRGQMLPGGIEAGWEVTPETMAGA